FTDAGASFLFGSLFNLENNGVIFVIHVLPTVIFFSSLMAIFYHLGAMQKLIAGVAWVMQKTMRTSGSESLSAAANIFVGQTEAPLVIRPYVNSMTNSEIMAVMCGGFATVAGGVLAAYVRFGVDAGHLLAASIMSAPAALVIAKILYPETEKSVTQGTVDIDVPKEYANLIDAAAGGAGVGMKLAANIGAMLLAFIALVAMVDAGLGLVHLSLQQIFGWLFSPIAFCMGVPWGEATAFGSLLGTKIAVNEFLGYIQLQEAITAGTLSPRSVIIATYALCGFANFSSIAIQIGGIGGIAPNRRADVARMGIKAMFGGALASWLTATIAGILTVV
ncbi:NupC/NupG family nucleoside CNT transporter, partial [bacterium]|nr:NupC/NupG family nucleoside CNT transporter [bacterium]